MLLSTGAFFGASAGGAGGGVTPNYFDDVMLQLAFQEANGATTGADDSSRSFDWTGAGNAQVQSNELVLDGTGDYATLASNPQDWNFFHGGAPFTLEFLIDGAPVTTGSHRNVLIDTMNSSSANRGVWVEINASRQVHIAMGRGVSGQPIFDYTSTFTIPNDSSLHHLVIEFDPGNWRDFTNRLRFGLDGSRVEETDASTYTNGLTIADSSYDLRIGALNVATTLDYDGKIKGIRFWRNRLPYDLLNNSTYTYETDPANWPTSEVATGAIEFPARYSPNVETAAGGYSGTDFYHAEPRYIDLGSGSVLKAQYRGPTHAANSTGKIESFKSTNYGRDFLYSSRVVIASDATYACRNHAIGRDPSSGRLICFYRKTNSSDVQQGVFYKTSTDDGATWSSETEITSSVTGTVPFGKIVSTSVGLMAIFYKTDFAEALFSTDGGATWGSRTTIYDVTGTTPGYVEPFIVALSTSNLVAIVRADFGGGNNAFAFYKSTDGGATWAFSAQHTWTATTYSYGTPASAMVIGSNVVTAWAERSGSRNLKYTVTDATAYFTGPVRSIDGTETVVDVRSMSNLGGTGTDLGYPDVIPLDSKVFMGWYEGGSSSVATRTMETVFSL